MFSLSSFTSVFAGFFNSTSESHLEKHQKMVDRLQINSRDSVNQTSLHRAVLAGDKLAVEDLVTRGAEIDARDRDGATPLILAAQKGHFEITQFLVSKNADLEVVDKFQRNIVELAKEEISGKKVHTPLSKFLKRKLELDKNYLECLSLEFQHLLKTENVAARSQGKKILILLGESHGNYKQYQLEKTMLRIAHEAGISCLYVETSATGLKNSPSLAPIMNVVTKNKYKISLVAVDTHPERDTASVYERNGYIIKEIVAQNREGLCITGAEHLQGLLDAKMLGGPYHVIPINLKSILQTSEVKSPEAIFAADPSKVIQVNLNKNNCFTDAATASI